MANCLCIPWGFSHTHNVKLNYSMILSCSGLFFQLSRHRFLPTDLIDFFFSTLLSTQRESCLCILKYAPESQLPEKQDLQLHI